MPLFKQSTRQDWMSLGELLFTGAAVLLGGAALAYLIVMSAI